MKNMTKSFLHFIIIRPYPILIIISNTVKIRNIWRQRNHKVHSHNKITAALDHGESAWPTRTKRGANTWRQPDSQAWKSYEKGTSHGGTHFGPHLSLYFSLWVTWNCKKGCGLLHHLYNRVGSLLLNRFSISTVPQH